MPNLRCSNVLAARLDIKTLTQKWLFGILVLVYQLLCSAMQWEPFFFLQIIPPTNSLSFSYPYFSKGDVELEGDATLSRSEIDVTVNRVAQNNNNSVGRVTSFQMMRLWDMSPGKLTDFTTNFSFVVFSDTRVYGDGLAFFLADPELPILTKVEEGGGLGLVEGDQVLNSTEHSFVAVEFDTFRNQWDPNGPHVGINVNSMRSNTTAPWFPKWVMFGFSAATGSLSEFHTLQSWSFSSGLQISDAGGKKLVKGWLGIGISFAVIFLGLACVLFWKRTKGKEE